MNSRMVLALLVACGLEAGCAYTIVKPVERGDLDSRGYRYYDPLPLLLEGCTTTQIVYVPDFQRGYAVQPRTWLAKQDHELQLADGRLSQTKTSTDTTAILTLIQNVATEAIKNAASLAALSDAAGESNRAYATIRPIQYDAETGAFAGFGTATVLSPCPASGSAEGAAEKKAGEAGAKRPK